MPRDLLADQDILEQMSPLSRDPPTASPSATSKPMPLHRPTSSQDERNRKAGDVHPFAQLLNVSDLDDCDWLEHVAFDANEAASRDKLEYRLQTCGELCTGLFTSNYATAPGPLGEVIRSRAFPQIDASDSDRKRVILGHIIATKSNSNLVTDDAMNFPKDFKTKYQLNPSTGHNEEGQTVCLHSLCIHPSFAGKGLGHVLLKGYTQRIKDSGVAKRIALICREKLVGYYEKAGFKKIGPSKCQYGGGNWIDMVLEFSDAFGNDADF